MEGVKHKDFTKLEVWELSHELRLKINLLIKYLPNYLANQIIRSACSVSANIAEGHGRYHFQENIQFCRQARGSLEETKDHLLFIKDAKIIKKSGSIEHLITLCEQIKPLLNGYIAYLKKQKQSY